MNKAQRFMALLAFFATILLGMAMIGFITPTVHAAGKGYQASLDTDDEYVEEFKVQEQTDGTAPFDSKDADGDDASATNRRVRTFDDITYLTTLTSAPYTEGTYYKTGYIHYKFVLPAKSSEAVFDTSAMSWMVSGNKNSDYNWKITNETIDGKSCQVLTCTMYKSYEPNAFPCIKQTANVQIQVKNMQDGSKISPKFYAWMDHNETGSTCSVHKKAEVASCTPDVITVTAKESFNINCVSSPNQAEQMDADFSTGAADAPNKDAGKVHGAFFYLGNMIELRNTGNQNRKLRGIAWPDGGTITYDVELNPYYIDKDGNKQTLPKGSKVLLYDSGPSGFATQRAHTYGGAWDVPANKGYGCKEGCVNDTGKVQVVQDGNTLHVTITGYSLDETKYPSGHIGWQIYSTYYQRADYGKGSRYTNRGIFTTATELVGITYDSNTVKQYGNGALALNATVKNLKISGKEKSDADNADNSVIVSKALRGPGSYDNLVYYSAYGRPFGMDGRINSEGVSPDDATIIGKKINISWGFRTESTESNFPYAVDSLVKFNAKAFTPLDQEVSKQNYCSSGPYGRVEAIFAAKKDGTDWKDDAEMNAAKIEDLVYYKSMADLKKDGKVCVGMLESFRAYANKPGHDIAETHSFPVQVNNDLSLAGKVYPIMVTSNVYTEDLLTENKSEPTFADAYFNGKKLSTPKYDNFRVGVYKKSEWTNGKLTSTGNYCQDIGDSLYLMTYNLNISKNVEQTVSGKEKASFNLDNEEGIADYVLKPSSNNKLDMKTDITVTDTLPKGMKYNGDAVLGGTYIPNPNPGKHGNVTGGTAITPKVTENSDGTTTLVWTLSQFDLKNDIPEIHYSCTIDKAVAKNNQIYKNTASIASTEDKREPDATKGNLAEVSVSVVKLASFSESKRAEKPNYELPEDMSWNILWNNTSKNAESNVVMEDMMPYNGDDFGTKFHGSYTVKELKLTLDDPSKYSFYYTTDAAYRGQSTRTLSADTVKGKWTKGSIASDGTVTDLNGKTPVAWCIIGDLNAYTSLGGKITVSTKGAQIGDNYVNGASMMKNIVTGRSTYLTRSYSGYTFIDKDKNGYKDDGDKILPNVTVTLYKHGDHSTPAKNSDGKTCTMTTDKDGYYHFDNMPKGEYDVMFSGDTLANYSLVSTTKDKAAWYNKAANPTKKDDVLQTATIDSVNNKAVFEEKKDVSNNITYDYAYTQLDGAFYQDKAIVKFEKTDKSGNALNGAKLEIVGNSGKIASEWTSGTDAKSIRLSDGSYTYREITAPDGFSKAKDIDIELKSGALTVNEKAQNNLTVRMVDEMEPVEMPLTGRKQLVLWLTIGAIACALGFVGYKRSQKKTE